MIEHKAALRWSGILFLVTHVTSIAAVVLYGRSTLSPDSALAGRVPVLCGVVLELILAAAIVGTATLLHPWLSKHSPSAATSYVVFRALESSAIVAGTFFLLPVVATPGTTTETSLPAGVTEALTLAHDWSFLIGPGLIGPIHAIILAVALWRKGLMPKYIPLFGLIGAPTIMVLNMVVLFGIRAPLAVGALPMFLWEISLAIYLIRSPK